MISIKTNANYEGFVSISVYPMKTYKRMSWMIKYPPTLNQQDLLPLIALVLDIHDIFSPTTEGSFAMSFELLEDDSYMAEAISLQLLKCSFAEYKRVEEISTKRLHSETDMLSKRLSAIESIENNKSTVKYDDRCGFCGSRPCCCKSW